VKALAGVANTVMAANVPVSATAITPIRRRMLVLALMAWLLIRSLAQPVVYGPRAVILVVWQGC